MFIVDCIVIAAVLILTVVVMGGWFSS